MRSLAASWCVTLSLEGSGILAIKVLWSALDLKDATAPQLGHSNCCRESKRATASIYALNAQFFRAKNVVQSQ